MKRISPPPLIILLDVLFCFLFFLILDIKTVEINIPQDKLFKGAILLYEFNGNMYDLNNKKVKLPDRTYLKKCGIQPQCISEKKKNRGDVYILIPKLLLSEVSKVTFIGFADHLCTKAIFTITLEGELDNSDINSCLVKVNNASLTYD